MCSQKPLTGEALKKKKKMEKQLKNALLVFFAGRDGTHCPIADAFVFFSSLCKRGLCSALKPPVPMPSTEIWIQNRWR